MDAEHVLATADRIEGRPQARERQIHPDLMRICVWPKTQVSDQHMWEALVQVLGETRIQWVLRVSRAYQPSDRRFRVDLEVRSGFRGKSVLARLRWAAKKTQKWLVRPHMSWDQRRRLCIARRGLGHRDFQPDLCEPPVHNRMDTVQPQQEREQKGMFVASWNIRSVANKRPEIELFLKQENVAVLALQETRRPQYGWPIRVKGYQCFETLDVAGQPGQRGVALLVREELVAYQVGDVSCSYMVAVKAAGANGMDMLIASVYVPPRGCQNRESALRQIKRAAVKLMRNNNNRNNRQVLFMGDWNMGREQLAQMLTRWRTSVPLLVRGCSGSALSFFGSRTWKDLDHMVVSSQCMGQLGRPTVHRAWDLSDHWPLIAWVKSADGDDGNDG